MLIAARLRVQIKAYYDFHVVLELTGLDEAVCAVEASRAIVAREIA